jgi:hypothetical protein
MRSAAHYEIVEAPLMACTLQPSLAGQQRRREHKSV